MAKVKFGFWDFIWGEILEFVEDFFGSKSL